MASPQTCSSLASLSRRTPGQPLAPALGAALSRSQQRGWQAPLPAWARDRSPATCEALKAEHKRPAFSRQRRTVAAVAAPFARAREARCSSALASHKPLRAGGGQGTLPACTRSHTCACTLTLLCTLVLTCVHTQHMCTCGLTPHTHNTCVCTHACTLTPMFIHIRASMLERVLCVHDCSYSHKYTHVLTAPVCGTVTHTHVYTLVCTVTHVSAHTDCAHLHALH